MGLRNLLGITQLEEENYILRQIVKNQNLTLQNIYAKTKEYKKANYSVAHVGLNKIEDFAVDALDFATEKQIELDNIE